MIERAVWMILKGIAFTLVIGASIAVIIWACCSCGKDASAAAYKPAPMYEGRMKFAGSSRAGDEMRAARNVYIWIDTETGICYAAMPEGGMVMLVNHDGSPFVANGWRDYSDSDS